MKITLDLSRHCVETEAKKLLEDGVRLYFKASETERTKLEERIEGLKVFLEQTDFGRLRRSDPILAGLESGKVSLHILSEGDFLLEFGGKTVQVPLLTA